MIAFIAYPWKLYAQESTLDGPLPTIIKFEENSFINLIGKPKEIGTIKEEYEENCNKIVHYYETAVDFMQEVRVYTSQSELLKGEITYMACSDKKCLKPIKMEFQIELS
jgi:thiol:disulfide interchange protein DsbD